MAAYTQWYCRCDSCRGAWRVDCTARKPRIIGYQVEYRDRHYRLSEHAQVIKRQADIRRRYRSLNEDQIRADRARLHLRGTKTCRECREVLTLASFYQTRQSPDGLGVHCRRCDRIKKYGLTEEQHAEIVERTGGRCVYCAGPYEHLDHVIPKRLDGTDDPENLVVSCKRCNLSKLGSRLQDWWPRHFVEHLRRTLPVPTREALLDLLATHGIDTDELLRAEREAADL